MKSKAYAELKICSKDINLIKLDDITGLIHSKYQEIGNIAVSGIKLDYSSWYYKTEEVDLCYTEELTDILCATLLPIIEPLILFIQEYNCQVFITIVITKIGEVTPSLTLNRNIINILERLKSTFAFDGL